MHSELTGGIGISVTPPESLVKYEAPIFTGFDIPNDSFVSKQTNNNNSTFDATNLTTLLKSEDHLQQILPPREWSDETGNWMQYVSREPGSRLDVIALQEQLDKRLTERKAREYGICSAREQLYAQCFDELIRQITIDSPERGLLLMHTRNELRTTVDAYKILYHNSMIFGNKKQLRAEQGIEELEEQVVRLETQRTSSEVQLSELRMLLDQFEKKETEKRNADEKRRKEEIEFLKYQQQQLEAFLKANANAK
jgi:dynein light intermediate chain, axonemal